jgi:CRISPR-associated protein (TIGR03986 family)
MPIPRHVNPPEDRAARAPYNFVPLPEAVLRVDEDGQPPQRCRFHDRYLPEDRYHNGWIDLSIETLTPLFLRGPVLRAPAGDGWDPLPARLRPDPWLAGDLPVIPGSSLRGMLRSLVEILTFSKVAPVSEAKPFFRSLAGRDDKLGRAYPRRIAPGGRKPEGGFLAQTGGDDWSIRPAQIVRVSREMLTEKLGLTFYPDNPNWPPPWTHQHQVCWITTDGSTVTDIQDPSTDPPGGPGWRQGTLVLTGNAPGKKQEFVFLDPGPGAEAVRIPDEVWRRFHDDDQLTQWQESAFPAGEPPGGTRPAAGHLRDGEPVFFVRSGDEVAFLGRAQMFRFPYDVGLADLVEQWLGNAGIDHAQALFGHVASNSEDPCPTIKGRIFVEDAVGVDAEDGYLYDSPVVPRILGSPKPTTYPHYLTQDSADPSELHTYLKEDARATAIRGHKLYWHRRSDEDLMAPVRESADREPGLLDDLTREDGTEPDDTQHTIVRPVKPGVTFQERIRFENLTDVELGALLSALRLPDGHAHKLGMAKPLGMGSIRLTPTLRLISRRERYRSWQSDGAMASHDVDGIEHRCLDALAGEVLRHARATGELMTGKDGLAVVARLDALFTLLRWPGPPFGRTAALVLDPEHGANEFLSRRVLPTPFRVTGVPEPGPSPASAPRPAPLPPRDDRPAPGALARALADAQSGDGRQSRPKPPKPLKPGQIRPGRLRRRGDGTIEAVLELGDGKSEVGAVVNPDDVPRPVEGGEGQFRIEQMGAWGLRVRWTQS